jgi:CheY-like chemotaxis protein
LERKVDGLLQGVPSRRKRFSHEVAGSAPPRFLHQFVGGAVCRHHDDRRAFAETVTEMLESMGHTWEEAENVADAVAKAEAGSFDYILCDLELPLSYGRLPNLAHGLGLIETLAKMPSCTCGLSSITRARGAVESGFILRLTMMPGNAIRQIVFSRAVATMRTVPELLAMVR